jgi:hypothetical protein
MRRCVALTVGESREMLETSIAIADAAPPQVGRGSIALVGTLLARSFGLAAAVALVLLVMAMFWA